MARYFLTAQRVFYVCGTLQVSMISKPQEHLWLLYTTTAPTVKANPDRRQPSRRRHSNTFYAAIEGVVEQEESGQTFTHTFTIPWPSAHEYIWFYTINQGLGPTEATRSPFFAYRLPQLVTWQEPWSPLIDAYNPWQIIGPSAPFTNNYNPGNVQLHSACVPFSYNTTGVLDLGSDFGSFTDLVDSCGMMFTFTQPPASSDPELFGPLTFLRIINPSLPDWPLNITFYDPNTSAPPTPSPPPTNQLPIALSPGQHTVALGPVITARHLQYPTSLRPGPAGIGRIVLNAAGSRGNVIFDGYSNFGPLTMTGVSGELTEVTKYWRSIVPYFR